MAVLEKIEEIFSSPEQFSQEKLGRLLTEVFGFLGDLKGRLDSNDERVRKEASDSVELLKARLQREAEKLCQSLGMDPAILETYLNDASNFTPEEWEAVEKAKEEVVQFRENLKQPNKKPKIVKEWLMG